MRRGRARAAAATTISLALAACFSPSPAPGLPCTPDNECPSGQVCDTAQSPPLCVEDPATRIDAAPPDVPDAAPPISCDDGDLCPAEVPICDDGTCRGCIADAECPSGACLELDGVCADADAIVFTSPSGTGTACSALAPCALAIALQSLGAERYVIRLGPGNYLEVDVVLFDTGATTTYVSGPDRSWDSATLYPSKTSVRIREGAHVVLEGFSIVDSPIDAINLITGTLVAERLWLFAPKESGLDATNATATLREVVIENAQTHGIIAIGSTLTVDRAYLVENGSTGLYAEGGTIRVTNTALLSNGLPSDDLPAMHLENVSAASVIAFTTFAGNVSFGGPGAIDCLGPSPAITSSIFADNPEPQVDDSCDVTHSLFTGPAPAGNTSGDPMFVSMRDFRIGIGPASDARGLGEMVPGVTTDIDGEPRPQGGYDAGADEVP
jgi:hypothetical protein